MVVESESAWRKRLGLPKRRPPGPGSLHWQPRCHVRSAHQACTSSAKEEHVVEEAESSLRKLHPVALSYAVCGTDARMVVLNGLQFTEPDTQIIVHTCHGGQHKLSSIVGWLDSSHQIRRYIPNPQHLRMGKNTPSVLAAHLSNFALCESPGKPCAGDKSGLGRFVIMAGNAVLIRPGLEAWVNSHSLSFCRKTGGRGLVDRRKVGQVEGQ